MSGAAPCDHSVAETLAPSLPSDISRRRDDSRGATLTRLLASRTPREIALTTQRLRNASSASSATGISIHSMGGAGCVLGAAFSSADSTAAEDAFKSSVGMRRFPFPPQRGSKHQSTRDFRTNSGPGRLFGIHARNAALTVKMADRHARRLRRRRSTVSLYASARPADDRFRERRLTREQRRWRHAQRRLSADGMRLDALHALGNQTRDRSARAQSGREHSLLRDRPEQKDQEREHAQPTRMQPTRCARRCTSPLRPSWDSRASAARLGRFSAH